jgi:VanZ family protein
VGLYALGALAPRPLERAHLPEYGLAAYLAWRAARPALGAGVGCYAAALGTAAVIGWVEEVVQGATPGRYFAWHDVGVNALGAALGLGVLASLRAAAADRDPSR